VVLATVTKVRNCQRDRRVSNSVNCRQARGRSQGVEGSSEGLQPKRKWRGLREGILGARWNSIRTLRKRLGARSLRPLGFFSLLVWVLFRVDALEDKLSATCLIHVWTRWLRGCVICWPVARSGPARPINIGPVGRASLCYGRAAGRSAGRSVGREGEVEEVAIGGGERRVNNTPLVSASSREPIHRSV
jgi:hypothetical protein